VRHCLVSLELITLDDEPCVLSMIIDITDRKLAEQALQRNTALTTLLQEVSVAANEALSVENALRFAIQRVCDFTGWELGHVYLLTHTDNPQLMSSVWYDRSGQHYERFRAASDQMRFDGSDSGLIFQVTRTARAAWTDDVSSILHPTRAHIAQDAGISACYAFPVFSNTEVAAVMEFFSSRHVEPDQALLDTIAQVASQVGRVIERNQASSEFSALYNATSYLFNADSLNDLAQQIVNGIVTEFDQVDCGLLLLDRERDELVRLARAGVYNLSPVTALRRDGQGLVPKAIREGQMIYAPDVTLEESYVASVPTTRSELIVPLKTHEKIIGVLDLQSADVDHFSRSDRRVLSAFAERAAAAIEIMQLVVEINQYAAQLEQRVAERTEELQRAKQRAETILNNSSDAILMTDVRGMIRQTNPRFDSQFGYGVDELFGGDLSAVFTQESLSALMEAVADVSNGTQYRRLEAVAQRRDGSTLPVDVALSGFSDEEHKSVVCSLRDISEQKKLEQELREAFQKQKELTELKTRFVSMVSHEYRTPLAAIMTSSSILKDYSERMTPERRVSHLETIQTQVQHLTELLDEVLQINKAETIQIEFRREKVDFVAFCRDVVRNVQQISPARQIDFTVSGDPLEVGIDTKLARQIIGNLLSNALKYSPEEKPVRLAMNFEPEQVVLKVRDEGIGIPPEDQEQLFQVYHRARNVGSIQGTGLGLVIIKQAIDAHGGSISVESTLGQGTTFTVALPILE
jgi:PAS domain S-box-containing protein